MNAAIAAVSATLAVFGAMPHHHHHHHHHHHRVHHRRHVVAPYGVEASWYYDQGSTACGFHATYGVANRTLPCGTRVTLEYGRTWLVATVDDRGPFIYSRTFDLSQTTRAALGCPDICYLRASATG